MTTEWRKCSICKKPINLNQIYQKCSVSTCRKNIYCTVECWDVHVPVLNHKSAWAEEERAPRTQETEERSPRRIIVSQKKESTQGTDSSFTSSDIPKDILTVVSKLKTYVKARSDMNTSADVADVISDIIRSHVDGAIIKARQDGRKTLMGKDF